MAKGYIGKGAEREFAEEDKMRAAMKRKMVKKMDEERMRKMEDDEVKAPSPSRVKKTITPFDY